MTIYEMTNDQASDAMIRISAALCFVLEDKEVMDVIKEAQEIRDKTILEGVTMILPKVTALVFRKHRDSLYEIVGALSQQDRKAVGKMGFRETVELLKENWGTLKDFFPSSASGTETKDKEPVA